MDDVCAVCHTAASGRRSDMSDAHITASSFTNFLETGLLNSLEVKFCNWSLYALLQGYDHATATEHSGKAISSMASPSSPTGT